MEKGISTGLIGICSLSDKYEVDIGLKSGLFFKRTFLSLCLNFFSMSKVCQVSGKRVMSGHKVSHSNIKTLRKFYPNLQKKRFFIPEENRWVELKVSMSVLRTINKNGITAVLKKSKVKV